MNRTWRQSVTGTVFDTTASTSPPAFRKFIVSSSSDGPGFATTSSTSTAVNLGSDGVKVCRTSLSRFVHAFFHGAVFAWSGVMDARSPDRLSAADSTRIVTVKVSRFVQSGLAELIIRNCDLCLSFGSRLENVDKRCIAGNGRPCQCDAFESDYRGRDLRGAVLLGNDCSEGYLYLLAHRGDQVLSIVREVEGQHLLLDACRGHVELLSGGTTPRSPQEGQPCQGECWSCGRHSLTSA